LVKIGIAHLRKSIDASNQRFKELSESDPEIGRKVEALIAHMPELGTLNRRECAALAGVAPMNRDRGPYRGRRRISAGRTRVRRALYLAALSASKHHPQPREFYQRLRSNGKAPKVALVAVMRKLIAIANQVKTNKDCPRLRTPQWLSCRRAIQVRWRGARAWAISAARNGPR